MRTQIARSATVVATLALAGSGLVLAAPAAQAAPVFTTSTFTTSSIAHDDAACTPSGAVEQGPTVVPITENAGSVGGSAASSVTVTGVPGDVMTGSSSVTGSGAVSSVGANLNSINHVANGQVNVTATVSPSACDLHMVSSTQLDYEFTVASPGFLTIDIARKGATNTEFYLEMLTPDDSSYYDEYGAGFDTTTSRRIYLPAGTYSGYTNISAGVDDRSTPLASTPSGSIHATFALVGTQSAAVQGKAKKYVTYPATRSCATHTLNVAITNKKKRAGQIKQVAFYINDTKVKKARTPDKGDAFALQVADNVDAELRSVVKLFPRRPGQKGKVYEASATYRPCSA